MVLAEGLFPKLEPTLKQRLGPGGIPLREARVPEHVQTPGDFGM
jgi:hypothetical protein